jgi:hypothetical protein
MASDAVITGDDQRADGVPDGRDQHFDHRADVRPPQVHPDQGRHPGEADQQSDDPPAREVVVAERPVEDGPDERHRCDE